MFEKELGLEAGEGMVLEWAGVDFFGGEDGAGGFFVIEKSVDGG